MQVVNVRQLKSNPSVALREARTDLVVVMNRDRPDAVLIGMEQLDGLPDFAHVRQALAVSLFKQGQISLTSAAHLADEPLGAMLDRLARLGVPVAHQDGDTLSSEVEAAAAWIRTPR
jgi:predicted HTH domain antitoxin